MISFKKPTQLLKCFKREKGMTLLEIMIVISILAGLAAVLVTQITGNLKKANIKQAKIQMGEITKSVGMYYQDCRKLPETLSDLIEKPESCGNWGPDPYLKKRQITDPWNNEFLIEKTDSSYVLISFGADGKEGGKGENADITSEDL